MALAGCSGSGAGSNDQPATSATDAARVTPGASSTGAAPSTTSTTVAPATGASVRGPKVKGAALTARIVPAVRAAGGRSVTISATGAQAITGNGLSAGTGSSLNLLLKADLSSMSGVQIITRGSDVYLRTPTAVIPGRPWVQITDAPTDPYRTLYDTVFSGLTTAGDVEATAGVIRQIPSFTTGPAEVIDGVSCVRYSATPSAVIAVKMMPQSLRSIDSATLKRSQATVDVWLDGTGLPHRISTSLELPGSGKGSARSQVSYSGWGTEVTVSPPPSDQIAPQLS